MVLAVLKFQRKAVLIACCFNQHKLQKSSSWQQKEGTTHLKNKKDLQLVSIHCPLWIFARRVWPNVHIFVAHGSIIWVYHLACECREYIQIELEVLFLCLWWVGVVVLHIMD